MKCCLRFEQWVKQLKFQIYTQSKAAAPENHTSPLDRNHYTDLAMNFASRAPHVRHPFFIFFFFFGGKIHSLGSILLFSLFTLSITAPKIKETYLSMILLLSLKARQRHDLDRGGSGKDVPTRTILFYVILTY